MIDRQTGQRTRLVDDLLDVARLARGQVVLKPELLEVGTVLEQAAETVQPLIAERGHRLRVDRPQDKLFLRGDRARLVQAVGNLLHNAAKYSDPRCDITVRVRATDARIELEVQDQGVGIPPELLPRVFELFVQSERTLDRALGGLGIGLPVAKRLVAMHGGSVQARSDGTQRGASFTIDLPRAFAPRPAPADPPPPPVVAGRRVLVVDDNADAADSMALLLTLDGHAVQTVYSGAAALSAVQADAPDVVLLDIGMPQMDGFEVARRLRERAGACPLLVAVTGYGQDADQARARAAGFDAHLTKPVDIAALARLLVGLAPRSAASPAA